jgi:hypothetical protein
MVNKEDQEPVKEKEITADDLDTVVGGVIEEEIDDGKNVYRVANSDN